MNLFSDDFPDITSDEEIAEIASRLKYDAGYVCQGGGVLRRKTKEWMEGMWKQYEPYADRHFLTAFKKQFTQRAWELYLGITFLNRGFKLGKHREAGPDFEVLKRNKRIAWVEAIAVRPGDGADKVPEVVYGMVMSVPEDEMLLRVASGLNTKHEKYLSDLKKGLVGVDDPYVIALNRSELGHVEIPPSLILKALFGIGHMTLSFPVPEKGMKPIRTNPKSGWSMQSQLTKQSGGPVSMLFFENPAHAGISAVIYCIDHVIGLPRLPKQMGENFIIVHNPHAKNPLPPSALPFGDEYRAKDGYVSRTRKHKQYRTPSAFEHLDGEE